MRYSITPWARPKTRLAHPFPIAKMPEPAGIRRSRGFSKLLSSTIALRSIAAKAFRTGLVIGWHPKGTASRKSPYSFRIRGRSRPRVHRRGCALSLGRRLARPHGFGLGLLAALLLHVIEAWCQYRIPRDQHFRVSFSHL